VREHLRDCFTRWGLPKALRVDNGDPWATRSDVPSALALWLVGLEVKLLNRPRQSTDNRIVERDHGVLANWVEPERAGSVAAFQAQLDWTITMQREQYPAVGRQSRLQAYPMLETNPRRYSRETEAQQWQFERVQTFLRQFVWSRRVDKVGRISLFGHAYSVGRAAAGQQVAVVLDSQRHEWLIQSEQGQVLKRYACVEVTPERIAALDLTKRANSVSPQPA